MNIAQPTAADTSSALAEIVRARDIAKRYDVTERCVLNWKDQGLIPHIQIGRTVRFRLSDVIAKLEGGGA